MHKEKVDIVEAFHVSTFFIIIREGRLLFFPAEEPIHGRIHDVCQSVRLDVGHWAFLTFRQGQGRHAHANIGQLQLGEQLHLPHALRFPGFGYSRANQNAVSQCESSWFHLLTTLIAPLYA